MADAADAPIPRPALWLGVAGTLPFVIGAAAMSFGPGWVRVTAYVHMMNYAAVVLAWLGAVHWGLAMRAPAPGAGWGRYALAAAPALLGWLALGLIQPLAKLFLFALAYAAIFLFDVRATRDGLAPAWYPRLRKPLTIVILIAIAAMGIETG